jgi:hypothetical protein
MGIKLKSDDNTEEKKEKCGFRFMVHLYKQFGKQFLYTRLTGTNSIEYYIVHRSKKT